MHNLKFKEKKKILYLNNYDIQYDKKNIIFLNNMYIFQNAQIFNPINILIRFIFIMNVTVIIIILLKNLKQNKNYTNFMKVENIYAFYRMCHEYT